MADYVCPNGHVFPGALTVPCDECGAAVVCEPIAAGMRLHEALEATEAELARVREAVRALERIADGRYVDASGRRRRFTSRDLRDIAAEALGQTR